MDLDFIGMFVIKYLSQKRKKILVFFLSSISLKIRVQTISFVSSVHGRFFGNVIILAQMTVLSLLNTYRMDDFMFGMFKDEREKMWGKKKKTFDLGIVLW